MTTSSRTLNVGVVGLGLAAASVTPAMVAMPHVNLVAGADINPRALQAFKEKYGAKTYASIEALCDDPDIDAVWIATPNTCHCPHVILAAERGKHVIVEKPMAISLAEAERMIEAAERHGVQLLCGGSRSSSAVVRKMREVVVSGALGRLRAMITWSATDWMLRPRRPDELDVSQGGGVVYRQAPHQVDSVRLLAGGKVSSVRGVTGQWMAPRHTAPGFFPRYSSAKTVPWRRWSIAPMAISWRRSCSSQASVVPMPQGCKTASRPGSTSSPEREMRRPRKSNARWRLRGQGRPLEQPRLVARVF
jgi:predicted dehydrogenase